MKQEDKELLLKDLSARLPYEVYAETVNELGETHINRISPENINLVFSGWFKECKPYLRPMSSMTEEEFVHFMALRGRNLSSYDIRLCMKEAFNMPNFITIVSPLYNYLRNIEWLLSKHFDAHGLIEKNLALDCTGLHIYD